MKLLGTCSGCGRGIPQGYTPYVSEWGSRAWGKEVIHYPEKIWCKDCKGPIIGEPRKRKLQT